MNIIERFLDTDRGVFHAFRMGSGPSVFFCHGNSMSAGTYLPFLEKVAQAGYEVVAPDLRGHGKSTKERIFQIRDWQIFYRDLKLLVQSSSQQPVIGIGHSMGGFFIYTAAALFPGLFSKIVLLDPIILPGKWLWGSALMRLTRTGGYYPLSKMARNKKHTFESRAQALEHYSGKGMFKTWQPEFVQAFVETAIEKDDAVSYELCCPPAFEASLYTMAPLDTWKHAKKIKIPALVIRGEHSEMFRRESGEKLSRMMADCRFEELKNQGHFFMMENPDAAVRSFQHFLA